MLIYRLLKQQQAKIAVDRLRRATETERRRGGLFDSERGYCPNHGCVHPGEAHHRDGTCSVPHCLCMAKE